MASSDKPIWHYILGGAKVVLGVAFVAEGVKTMTNGTSATAPLLNGARKGLGHLGRMGQQQRAFFDRPVKTEVHTVSNIDQRVAYIRKMVRKSSLDPETKADASKVLTRKCGGEWCVQPKNYKAEIAALFTAVTDPKSDLAIRYVRDHVTVDQFAHRRITKKLKMGDCDDQVVALGSMLMSVGYPVKLRVVQTTGQPSFNHIYLVVGMPPEAPTRWMALDTTMVDQGKEMGWQVPGAERVAISGKPAGEVIKLKDFDV